MALDSGGRISQNARRVRRPDGTRLTEVGQDVSTVAFVIAGAVVVMTLVRFFPKIGGFVLLAVTLLLLNTLFMGRSA